MLIALFFFFMGLNVQVKSYLVAPVCIAHFTHVILLGMAKIRR